MADVMVDGMWVASRAHASSVKWSTRYGDGQNGPDMASCLVAVDPGDDSTWLRLGRTFEVFEGGVKVFGGKIGEVPNGYPREIHAKGWARCEDRDQTSTGERWGRTVDNVAYTPAADATPTWFLDASGLDIGVADDGLYTRVVATYVSSQVTDSDSGQLIDVTSTVTVDDGAAQTLYDVITYRMDLTKQGVMSAGAATAWATDQLREFTLPQWLNKVTVDSTRLLSLGGLPAYLPAVKAGQMVTLFNVPKLLGGIQNELAMNYVLGEVEHDSDNPTAVTIAPVRRAVRDLAGLAEEAAQARGAA